MGLKIVISSSRLANEKKAVIDELILRDNALAILGNSSKRIEYIYDCEKVSTVFGELPKQDEIDKHVIPQCDWFILVAPIRHVGSGTADEAKAAYAAVNLTISTGVRALPLSPPIVPLIPDIDLINVIIPPCFDIRMAQI